MIHGDHVSVFDWRQSNTKMAANENTSGCENTEGAFSQGAEGGRGQISPSLRGAPKTML